MPKVCVCVCVRTPHREPLKQRSVITFIKALTVACSSQLCGDSDLSDD